MRFGLFYELQRPRPWEPDCDEKLIREALEQVELADRLGFDYVWEVEHHFLEEYSHSSAPEIFLAAASQRTKRIRLGHGIVQLPPIVNHPARVAERIATLDLVSGGRVEFGTGQGSSQVELGGFGVDRDLKGEQWEEMLDVIVRMMTEEPFGGHQGRFLSMPPRNVVPKPKQKPHPPLWVACSRRETILQSARKGMGALSFSFVEPEEAKSWVDEYYSLVMGPECTPAGLAVNANVAVVLPFLCHQDEQTAIDRGIDGAHFFGFSLAYYYLFGKHQPGISSIAHSFQAQRNDFGFARELVRSDAKPLALKLLEHGLGSFRGAVGTPQQITDLLDRYERAGVDIVVLAAQVGQNRHEHICESLELFATHVMPHFRERAAMWETEKLSRLDVGMARAMERRHEIRREIAPGYTITPHGESGPTATLRLSGANGPAGYDISKRLLIRVGKVLLLWLVRGRSEQQLERMAPLLLPIIFKMMQRGYRPERAQGFAGEIEFKLHAKGHVATWVVEVANGKVLVKQGAARNARIAVSMSVPTFARITAELLEPMTAVVEGKLTAKGEVWILNGLSSMFGGPNQY
jgi:alkanesulfonate monooxygenase SsuD/methylene tetrahydromethanopterin reductase-like flavin-dependent oxidoreductase (luciferase family)